MVYLPSNGAPRLSIEIAAPARSFGLPRATPSNSANAPAICFGDRRGGARPPRPGSGRGRRWRRTPGRRMLRRCRPGCTVGQHRAGRLRRGRADQRLLLAMSQPRTCTSLTCSAEVTHRAEPQQVAALSRTSGSSTRRRRGGATAVDDDRSCRRCGRSDLEPMSRASRSRNSQSVWPAWLTTWSNTVLELSDLADLQTRPLGHLGGDVGRGHLRVALGAATAEQPVRGVVAADDGECAAGVELELERGDLSLDQGRGARELAVVDLDRDLADRSSRCVLPSTIRSGSRKRRREQVGQSQAVVDERGDQQRVRSAGMGGAVDRHQEGLADVLVTRPSPPGRRQQDGRPVGQPAAGRRCR